MAPIYRSSAYMWQSMQIHATVLVNEKIFDIFAAELFFTLLHRRNFCSFSHWIAFKVEIWILRCNKKFRKKHFSIKFYVIYVFSSVRAKLWIVAKANSLSGGNGASAWTPSVNETFTPNKWRKVSLQSFFYSISKKKYKNLCFFKNLKRIFFFLKFSKFPSSWKKKIIIKQLSVFTLQFYFNSLKFPQNFWAFLNWLVSKRIAYIQGSFRRKSHMWQVAS